MANKKISQLAILGSDSGTLWVHVLKPDAGSPTGYTNYRQTRALFLEDVLDEIVIIQGDITTNTNDIQDLQNYIFKNTYDVTATFTFSQTAFSVMREIYISAKTSTAGTIKIGTSAGGDDIVSERTIEENDIEAIDVMLPIRASRTIYVTKTGGNLTVEIFSRKLELQ